MDLGSRDVDPHNFKMDPDPENKMKRIQVHILMIVLVYSCFLIWIRIPELRGKVSLQDPDPEV